MKTEAKTGKSISPYLRGLLMLLIVWCAYYAIRGWFDPMQFSVLAGDDLRSFGAARTGGFLALSDLFASLYRFRPVSAAVISAVAWWTNADFRAAASIGIAIHAFNVLLFLFLLRGVLRLPAILSFGLTAIAFLNRFATYLYIPEEALTEGFALSALVGILILVIRLVERPTFARAVSIGILYLVIIHLHERYLVLAAPLGLVALCSLRSARGPSLTLLAALTISALFNFGVKKFLLGTPILIGTTTQAIELNVAQIMGFTWHGALNLLGLNRGPAYLSLEDFAASPRWVQLVSLTTVGVSIILSIASLRSVSWKRRALLGGYPLITIFLLSTIGLLLLAASVTIRQEFRWLYSAYLPFLVFLSLSQRPGERERWPQIMLMCLILLAVAKETYLSRWQSRYFGFEADRTATELYQALKHVGIPKDIDSIVIRGNVPSSKWLFMGDAFAQMYHFPPLEVVSNDSPSDQVEGTRLFLRYNSATQTFELDTPPATSGLSVKPDDISALRRIAEKWPAEKNLASPGKRRMFAMTEDGVACMIAVAPVQISISVPPQAKLLHLDFSHIYALGDGTNLLLSASTPEGKVTLLTKAVPPLRDNNSPYWHRYDLKLPANTQEVDLRVFPGDGTATADWLGFRDFSFE